jgi:3-deoxy-7-phosphoheptulonate synthase
MPDQHQLQKLIVNDKTSHAPTIVDDVRITAVRPIISPALLHDELPPSPAAERLVSESRQAIGQILKGQDDRLLVVIGPCSIHHHDEAIEYAKRLASVREQFDDALMIVMRVYFEKPRTTVGWKGYINDPHLDGSFRMNEGLRMARQLLLDITDLGLPSATEYLDLLSPQYISDLIAWGAIGARTTESQSHRQLASGLSCPVGFKNGTDGSVKIAADAIKAANAPHAFIGMTKMGQAAIFETRGNEFCHIILRGGKTPNYDAESVQAACEALKQSALPEKVMIDFSHANSSKQFKRQIDVAKDVGDQIAKGDHRIVGVMVESHLNEGRQDLIEGSPLKPGVSITDACIGWDDSVAVLQTLADAVRARRS